VWEGSIHDDEGRLVATGRVRLLVLDEGAQIAGEKVGLKEG
jgi:1,4-dihydroxy-2-naphthoyl-CoA hydrolase